MTMFALAELLPSRIRKGLSRCRSRGEAATARLPVEAPARARRPIRRRSRQSPRLRRPGNPLHPRAPAMTVSAVRPWRTALRRERSLPSGVVGPVLLSALRRLASICLSELIEDQLENWVRFVVGRQLAWSACPAVGHWLASVVGALAASHGGSARILDGSVPKAPWRSRSGLILRFSHQVTSLPA